MSSKGGFTVCKVMDYKTHYRLCLQLSPPFMNDETKEKIRETKLNNRIKGNNNKLNNNISRAKSIIYQYACCNEWQYFVTLTINKDKFDRYDLEDYKARFTQWLRNKYSRYDIKIQYLFIPEKHKDGSWHMHGLINGLPESALQEFTSDMHIPYSILDRIKQGVKVYNWVAYSDKFGYCTIEPIQNIEAVCKYITKYICKDLAESVQEVGKHLYYVSRGLNKADTLITGSLKPDSNLLWDFKNDYVYIKSFSKEFYSESDIINLFNTFENSAESIK